MTRFWDRVSDWFSTDQDRDFIDNIKPWQEADLGRSRHDLSDLSKAPCDTRQKMEAMAAVFGLSPADISREHWREVDIARACGHCSNRRECSRFLRDGGSLDKARKFCPNYHYYEEMRNRSAL